MYICSFRHNNVAYCMVTDIWLWACEVLKRNVKILIMIQGEDMVVEISSVTIVKINENLYSL